MTQEQKTTQTYFDHLGKAEPPTGLGRWLSQRAAKRFFAFTQVKRTSRVLEIGPGRGDLAELFLAHETDYHAIEANPALATSLKGRGANVVCARVPPLPAFDERFDLVAMINVLEHMSGMEEALDLACQVRDLLKPGGRFVIHCPDYLSWRRHFFNCDFSHNYVTTRRRLSQLLINAGYDDIQGRYLSGPFQGPGAVLLSAVASRMPFGALSALWPTCGLLAKLYKLQLTFSRRILIGGANPPDNTIEGS